MLELLNVVGTKLVDDQNHDQLRDRGVGRDQHCRGQKHGHDDRTDGQSSLSHSGPRALGTELHETGSVQSPALYERDVSFRMRCPVFGTSAPVDKPSWTA